ncbi:hypothetical protein JB92DRAFT_2729807 [Gautieria morchelliformis]|nr:hypothetical protein JB92DRAFT_2729807 [Gautieria morchelliformis]
MLYRSTRNTRIERLWVEVGTQFARRWRAFFTRLEKRHCLDPLIPCHLWLLHRVFLTLINDDCQAFQDQWNHHPISGHKTKSRSPLDLRFIGETTSGTPVDDLTGVHRETLERYYGVDTESGAHAHGLSGAGHPSDEDSTDALSDASATRDLRTMPDESDAESDAEEFTTLQRQIGADLQANIKHQAVKVPRHQNPFDRLPPAAEAAFWRVLQELEDTGFQPKNMGVLPEEWDDGTYPTPEVLTAGRRAKEISVCLPVDVWLPRAVVWARSLHVLNHILFELDDRGMFFSYYA